MTILWFSNRSVLNNAMKESGTWLLAMARLITQYGDTKLVNITVNPNTAKDTIEIKKSGNIIEYLLPVSKLSKERLPSSEASNRIHQLCCTEAPDIVHVWGVENYFSHLLPRLDIKAKLLLDIQGLRGTCADVYFGDLSPIEILKTFKLREILFPLSKSIFSLYRQMRLDGEYDISVLKKYKYISTQSNWIRQQMSFFANEATIFQTHVALREEFEQAPDWCYPVSDVPAFYVSAAGAAPYKSIQTAFRAIKLFKERTPEVKLYVVGDFRVRGVIHTSGYLYFLHDYIQRHNLHDNIIFTGALTSSEIIDIARRCVAYIQTSYVESYSLALAEAQVLGVPCIISYAGAMPELAEHEKSGLFYSPGDYVSCAALMQRLIDDRALATRISITSRNAARLRHKSESVYEAQMNIYRTICNE